MSLPRRLSSCALVVVLSGCASAPRPQTSEKLAEPQASEAVWTAATAQWWHDRQVSADGKIHEEELLRAHLQRTEEKSSATAPAATSALRWTFRGPDNVGGRTRSLVIDPRDANVLYAAAVTGGIWKSYDAGATWAPLADFLPSLNANALAIDPQAPDTLYVGTGEGAFLGSSFVGIGVLRSDDGGATWQHLSSTAAWKWVNRVVVSPVDSNVIMVSGEGGVHRSTDRGATWSTVRPASTAWDLQVDPTNPSLWLATVFDLDPGQDPSRDGWYGVKGAHQIVRSTTAGATWSTSWSSKSVASQAVQFAGLGRVELAITHTGSGIVYALGYVGLEPGLQQHLVLKSTDHGASFARLPSTFHLSGQPWPDAVSDIFNYMLFVWVSPTDDNLLLGGGYLISRSVDGGKNWDVFDAADHGDNHAIVAPRGYNGTTNRGVYVLSDGGVARLNDVLAPLQRTPGGTTSLNHGYQTTQFYSACGHGAASGLLGGTQDNAFNFLPNGSQTAPRSFVLGSFDEYGDGGSCAFDPGSPNRIYAEDVFGKGIGRGDTTSPDSNGNPTFTNIAGDLPSDGTGWLNPPLVIDPNDGRRLWLGHLHLWRSDNARDTASPHWQQLYPAVGTPYGAAISSIAVAPGDSNRVWWGDDYGRIYYTADGLSSAPHWTALPLGYPGPLRLGRAVTAIAFDRFAANTIYLAYGGFDAANLWRTQDGGSTWQQVTGSGALALPAVPIYAFVQHPSVPNWWFVGTEIGVFATYDSGKSWVQTPSGLPAVIVDHLEFLPQSNTLLAATFGRGMWTLDTTPLLTHGACTTDDNTLCLGGGRYLVRASWHDGKGHAGDGHSQQLTADTGYFWFFGAGNVELILKVLDGCAISHRKWIFAAGLTNVEVDILVLDTLTGANHLYRNPAGQPFQPIQDTNGLDACGTAAADQASTAALPSAVVAEPATGGDCTPSATALCLNGGRFRVETRWTTSTGSGNGHAAPLTGDSGYFWFFSPTNVEEIVKVLDACALNQSYWVFGAGLTNVKVTTTVTDTRTGKVKQYQNAAGQAFRPIQDVSALPCH